MRMSKSPQVRQVGRTRGPDFWVGHEALVNSLRSESSYVRYSYCKGIGGHDGRTDFHVFTRACQRKSRPSGADLAGLIERLCQRVDAGAPAARPRHLRPGADGRAGADHPPGRRPRAADRRARPRQDQAGRHAGRGARPRRQARAMHARPDAGRHHRLRSAGGERVRPALASASSRARSSASC